MRIFRIVVVLLVALAVIFPQSASANETINTETNINKTLLYFSDLLSPDVAQAKEGLLQIKDEKENKTAEQIAYENVLAKWKEKQEVKWANLSREPFTINASAYTAAADECDKTDGITASGLSAKANRTIACPPEFPFGAKIKIADLGVFVCEDRGGAIKGNKIDIFMETKKEAFGFGRQNLTAQVVD